MCYMEVILWVYEKTLLYFRTVYFIKEENTLQEIKFHGVVTSKKDNRLCSLNKLKGDKITIYSCFMFGVVKCIS